MYSTNFHLPNHLMFGSTLATVPGATVDWNCKGLMTFPRLLLEAEDQRQSYNSIYKYDKHFSRYSVTHSN